jgi:hypothetical protein
VPVTGECLRQRLSSPPEKTANPVFSTSPLSKAFTPEIHATNLFPMRPTTDQPISDVKISVFLRLVVPLATCAFGGCSTSPMSRIDDNRAKYESWPLEVQEAVLNGVARKGMTPEQVEMALGKPTQVVSRSAKEGEDEIWVYRKSAVGSTLLNNTGVSVGTSIGGVNVGTGLGGMGARQTPDEQEVVFGNGVVIRSDAKR